MDKIKMDYADVGGLTQTRTGTDKIHTILSRDCLPISA